MSMRMVNYFYF